jgi:hypothetical protein
MNLCQWLIHPVRPTRSAGGAVSLSQRGPPAPGTGRSARGVRDQVGVAGLLVGQPLRAVGFSAWIAVGAAVRSDRMPAASARCSAATRAWIADYHPIAVP